MAQVQKYGEKERLRKYRTHIWGISSVYMMFVISGFSADTAKESSAKSIILARFVERGMRKLLTTMFAYDVQTFTSNLAIIIRKFAHITEFFLLEVFFAMFTKFLTSRVRYKFSAALAVLYAVFDEIHQIFVPGRGPAVSDVAVDTVGVILAVLFLRCFLGKTSHNI